MINGPDLYAYVMDNPARWTDPNGTDVGSIIGCFLLGLIIGAVGAAVVGAATLGVVVLVDLLGVSIPFIGLAILLLSAVAIVYFVIEAALAATNPNRLAYLAGSFVGAALVGGVAVAEQEAAFGAGGFAAEADQLYNPFLPGGSFAIWASTSPTAAGSGGAALAGGVGAGSATGACSGGCT